MAFDPADPSQAAIIALRRRIGALQSWIIAHEEDAKIHQDNARAANEQAEIARQELISIKDALRILGGSTEPYTERMKA